MALEPLEGEHRWEFDLQLPSRTWLRWLSWLWKRSIQEKRILERCRYSGLTFRCPSFKPFLEEPAAQAVVSADSVTARADDFPLIIEHLWTDRGLPEHALDPGLHAKLRPAWLAQRVVESGVVDVLSIREVSISPKIVQSFLPREATGHSRICLGFFKVCLRMKGAAKLTIVRHGIVVDVREVQIACPGVEIVVSAPALRADLSDFTIVDDGRLQRLLSNLRGLIHQALREHIRQLRMLNAKQKLRIARAYPFLAAQLCERPPSARSKHSGAHLEGYPPPRDDRPPPAAPRAAERPIRRHR